MKNEFLIKLRAALKGLPQEEIERTIDYYSEIIDDAVEDGEDEQTVIDRQGSIDDIAENIINEVPVRKLVREGIKDFHMSAALVILLIMASPIWFPVFTALFILLFTLYIMLWVVAAVLFAVLFAIALSGAAMLITTPFLVPVNPVKAMLSLGMALICGGFAVFLFYMSIWYVKLTAKFTLFLIRQIKNIFIKRRNDEK